jgi:hypothetical protein
VALLLGTKFFLFSQLQKAYLLHPKATTSPLQTAPGLQTKGRLNGSLESDEEETILLQEIL